MPSTIIDFPCVVIRVSKLYQPGMDVDSVYDITQGWWVLGPQRERAQYVVAVSDGIVRGVFRVLSWRPRVEGDRDWQHDAPGKPRWGFEGEPADECQYLVGNDVRDLFTQGQANPILYLNVEQPIPQAATAVSLELCPLHLVERDEHGACPACGAASARVPFPQLVDHHQTDVFDRLVTPFAQSIVAKAALLDDEVLTKRMRSALRNAISEDIKKCCDIIFPAVRQPHVSRRAQDAADELGTDLRVKASSGRSCGSRGSSRPKTRS